MSRLVFNSLKNDINFSLECRLLQILRGPLRVKELRKQHSNTMSSHVNLFHRKEKSKNKKKLTFAGKVTKVEADKLRLSNQSACSWQQYK